MTSRLVPVLTVLPLLTGCVQPTLGPLAGPAESSKAQFVVRVVTPSAAPRPTGSGGILDLVSPGAVTVVVGWVPSEDVTLIVVTSAAATVLDERRYIRRDAAAAVADPSHPDLGFRVVLRPRTGVVDRVCVLAERHDGQVLRLVNSDASTCPAS